MKKAGTADASSATEHSFLCSEHFTEDCFEVNSELVSHFGMKRRRRLMPGAVPTIFHRPYMAQERTSEAEERSLHKRTVDACPIVGDKGPSKRKRVAAENRERLEVYQIQFVRTTQ